VNAEPVSAPWRGAAEAAAPVTARPWLWRCLERPAYGASSLAIAYFLGSLLGLSLQFPGTQISVFWPPNAVLLAALLVTPRRRWRLLILAVLPAHVLAQLLMGIPITAVLINFVGNTGEALLGAVAVDRFLKEPRRLDDLRAVILIVLLGGLLAPAVMSLVVAQLFGWLGLTTSTWLSWRLRLLTNTLAVVTLVPPVVVASTTTRSPAFAPFLRRHEPGPGEAGLLITGILVIGLVVFALPQAGAGWSPVLLYLPLPLLLWAALRFGMLGASLSVLALGALALTAAVNDFGPFASRDPVSNATSLVLFLIASGVPLLMLAALLNEREDVDLGRRRIESLHGAVLASLRDRIAVLDRDGIILEVNESWRASGSAPPGANYLESWRLEADRFGEGAAHMLLGVQSVLHGAQDRFHLEVASSEPTGSWFEISAERLKRPEGGAAVTSTDISARKNAELEAREQRQELAHLTRVAMLGELSGAMAHELNQPLTAILSNAQAAQRMLAREPADLAEIRAILRDIADDDRRAGEIIQRLRAMLKKDDPQFLPLDLNEMAGEVLALERSDLIARNVAVTTELDFGLPPVRGDRVQLQQVLLNLVLNACESMQGRPTWERRIDVVTVRDHDAARLCVVDRGIGIQADELERVFEPFFTTKRNGLGLGLSICRSIVSTHGGRLWASNNEDAGATFHLTLPFHDSPTT
jgi:signal transduction histidine kinase